MRKADVLAALLLASIALSSCSDRAPAATVAAAGAASAPREAPSAIDTADPAPPPPVASATAPDAGADGGARTQPPVPPEPRPCPEGMSLVQRFCIDRFEAVLVGPGDDGALAALPHNHRPPRDVRFEARSLPDVMPQAYISRTEAAAACSNAGKRLCSMREWRRACEGPKGWHWPYGSQGVAGRCNHNKDHLLALRYGPDARRWKYDEQFNDPSLDVTPGFLAKTGAYAACTTPDGVRDLVGNLHEWVSDMVDADLVEKLEAEDVERRTQPWKEGNGVFMGGFFSTADQHGPGCTFTTIAHEPAYHDYSIGFRCCAPAALPRAPRR